MRFAGTTSDKGGEIWSFHSNVLLQTFSQFDSIAIPAAQTRGVFGKKFSLANFKNAKIIENWYNSNVFEKKKKEQQQEHDKKETLIASLGV